MLPETKRVLLRVNLRFFLWRFNPITGMASPHCASRSHSLDTPQTVGLLWTSDQPNAETSTWQHTTLTRDKQPCPQRNSNPQFQHTSGCRPMP